MGNSCSSCTVVVVVVVAVAVAVTVAVAFVVLVVACVGCVLAFQQGNTGNSFFLGPVPPAGPPKPLTVMPMEAMKGATEISLVDWSLDFRFVVKSHLFH